LKPSSTAYGSWRYEFYASGELLDRLAGRNVDEDGVDLHEPAGAIGVQLSSSP
jgi:hypothetical protein